MSDKKKKRTNEDWMRDLPTPKQDKKLEDGKKVFYTEHTWKGVIKVYRCFQCNHCDEDEGDIQLHVITHYPESDKENILNKMLKEKQNG
jgi:hypothetical protein